MKTMERLKGLLHRKYRGYDVSDLAPIVVAFGLIAIVGAVVLLILNGFQTMPGVGLYACNTAYCNSYSASNSANGIYYAAYNGLSYGVSGINQITTFLPLIALVVVAAIIIGTVVGAFVLGGGAKKEF